MPLAGRQPKSRRNWNRHRRAALVDSGFFSLEPRRLLSTVASTSNLLPPVLSSSLAQSVEVSSQGALEGVQAAPILCPENSFDFDSPGMTLKSLTPLRSVSLLSDGVAFEAEPPSDFWEVHALALSQAPAITLNLAAYNHLVTDLPSPPGSKTAFQWLPEQGPVLVRGSMIGPEETDLFAMPVSGVAYQVKFHSLARDSSLADHLRLVDSEGRLLGDWELNGRFQSLSLEIRSRDAMAESQYLFLAVSPALNTTGSVAPDRYMMEIIPLEPYSSRFSTVLTKAEGAPSPVFFRPVIASSVGTDLSSVDRSIDWILNGPSVSQPADSSESPFVGNYDTVSSSKADALTTAQSGSASGELAYRLPPQIATSLGGALAEGEQSTEWLGTVPLEMSKLVAPDYEPGFEPRSWLPPHVGAEALPPADLEVAPVVSVQAAGEQLPLLVASQPVALLDLKLEPGAKPDLIVGDSQADAAESPTMAVGALAPVDGSESLQVPAVKQHSSVVERSRGPIVRASIGLAMLASLGFFLPDLSDVVRVWRHHRESFKFRRSSSATER